MNHVVLVGDLTGDIYYDQFLMKGKETPFLRLVLMTNKPYLIRGLRAVLYGESARLYYPYLAKGSKVAAIGQLVSRKHKGTTYHEVNTQQLVLLRNINWDAGERERQRNNLPTVSDQTNKAFLVGEITGEIFYSWFPTGQDGRLYAFMRMFLTVQSPGHDRIERLRVVVRGTLAEIAYPYLATGSKVAVDGHLQTHRVGEGRESRNLVELTAHNILFIDRINWGMGVAATRDREAREHADLVSAFSGIDPNHQTAYAVNGAGDVPLFAPEEEREILNSDAHLLNRPDGEQP